MPKKQVYHQSTGTYQELPEKWWFWSLKRRAAYLRIISERLGYVCSVAERRRYTGGCWEVEYVIDTEPPIKISTSDLPY